MKKGFRILKFKKDKPIFEVKDINKSFSGRPILKTIFKSFSWRMCGSSGSKRMRKDNSFFNMYWGTKFRRWKNLFK